MESKPILVTGSSGYIGSHLCKMLTNQGYQVIGLDVVRPKHKTNYSTYIIDINNPADVGYLSYDIHDEYSAVVHLAALTKVGESTQRPTDYYTTNVVGTHNLLRQLWTDHFIFASTGQASLMGNPYAISKRVAEEMVVDTRRRAGRDFTAFRFYNVIGTDGFPPTNPDGLFYNLIRAAEETGVFTVFGENYNTKDGTCVRDYVHVNEICEAICRAIEKPANAVENLGSGTGHTVNEIIDIFKRVNGVNFDVKYGGPRQGDIPVSVLDNPSSYFQRKYSIEDLLWYDPLPLS